MIPNAYETSWVMKDEADMIGDAGTRVEKLVFPHVCDQSDCVQGKKAMTKRSSHGNVSNLIQRNRQEGSVPVKLFGPSPPL